MSFTHFFYQPPSFAMAGGGIIRRSSPYTSSLILFFFCCLLDGMNLKWNGNHGNYGNKQTRTSIRLGIWGKNSWLWVEKGATASISHTSCDDCDPELLLLLLLFTTQGKERGKGRESGLGTEGLGNRNGGDGWDEKELDCHRAGLQYCSRGLLGKKEILAQAGRQGGRERDRDYFPFSLCSCARCFFLVYMIIFLFEDPLEWILFGEKLGRSIHVLALCHSGLKLSFLLRCIWS
jgi:hypothetical protein